ncbi:50S ribosomal protein L31 [Rickettsiales bacterium]|nr:50S ribosomal protein L31 [Rickettsiales bacterium]
MQQGIHPDYHKITVEMTDGTTFETRSTYGKEGDVLKLDIDHKTHPAWTGATGVLLNKKAGRVAKFNDKFAGLNFASKGKKQDDKDS